MTRIFLVAGESSGDLHGSNLVRAIYGLDSRAVCEGFGGTRMAEAGMVLHRDLAGRGIMGFTEVIRSLGYIRKVFREAVRRLEEEPPSCLVLIDYPGFNLRLAAKAKALGIPVVYYISPQVWAWKQGRVKTIRKVVDKMLVVLPFEERLYEEAGVPCAYVGHPLLDYLETVPLEGRFRDGLVIGLMPGSRAQEIQRHMPVMRAVAQGIQAVYPRARFVAPCVDAARERQVRKAAGALPIETVTGQTYELLDGARFCLVASGTATLETALFSVPMVVVYKISPLSYWIAKRLVRVDHIALANILAEERIVPEFVQHEATPQRVLEAALPLIGDTPARQRVLGAYKRLRARMGAAGASAKAARIVLEEAARSPHG